MTVWLGLLGLSFLHTLEQMPELGTEPCFISLSHQKYVILVSVMSVSEKSVLTAMLCQFRLSQWLKDESQLLSCPSHAELSLPSAPLWCYYSGTFNHPFEWFECIEREA